MSEQTSKKIYFTHDRFFKAALANLVVARDFFDKNLPDSLQKIINLDTLKLEPNTFVDPALQKTSSDVLFSVEAHKKPVYLYLLLEQQSKPDYWMPLRLCRYRLNVLEDYKKAHPGERKLPLVYAAVVYTGEDPYTAPTDFFELFHDSIRAKELFTEPFRLIDLQKIEDNVLKEQRISGTFQFFMKHIRAREFLSLFEKTLPILHYLKNNGLRDYVNSVICYTIYEANIPNRQQFLEDLNGTLLREDREGTMVTIAEQWMAEGREEGIIKGARESMYKMAKRLLARGLPLELIAETTELTKTDLQNLAKDCINLSEEIV